MREVNTQRVIGWIAWGLLGVAGVASYTHLYDAGTQHGQPPAIAAVLALGPDIGAWATLHAVKAAGMRRSGRVLCAVLLVVLLAWTGSANWEQANPGADKIMTWGDRAWALAPLLLGAAMTALAEALAAAHRRSNAPVQSEVAGAPVQSGPVQEPVQEPVQVEVAGAPVQSGPVQEPVHGPVQSGPVHRLCLVPAAEQAPGARRSATDDEIAAAIAAVQRPSLRSVGGALRAQGLTVSLDRLRTAMAAVAEPVDVEDQGEQAATAEGLVSA